MSGMVGIARCNSYKEGRVEDEVRRCIDLLGGITRFVKPGMRVLLKVNMLSATPPEKAVTTHPSVVRTLALLVKEAGGRPVVADSPGPVPYTVSGLSRAYEAAGLAELERKGIVALNRDPAVVGLPHPEGKLIKRLEVIKPVIESDVIIAVPKLKTHMFTTLTGATKIMFGVIPGLAKAGYHAKLQTGDQFAEMLLDIIGALKPVLYLMDGILALEGDGPGLHGKPRPLGIVMASADPVAMDVVACRITGMDPMTVPMLRAAAARSWWTGRAEDIAVAGVPVEDVAVDDFKKPEGVSRDARGLDRLAWYQSMWAPVVKQALSPRPVPGERCTGCATCRRACPQGAVTIVGGRAVINDRACIRCYCCHEMCPEAVVSLEYGLLGKVIRRLGWLGR